MKFFVLKSILIVRIEKTRSFSKLRRRWKNAVEKCTEYWCLIKMYGTDD